MSGNGSAPSTKRKLPPTFQHLPEHRGKKLKKLWVEKQKIKSKWKAEKRKEGIVTNRDVSALIKRDDRDTNANGEEEVEEEQSRSDDISSDEDEENPSASESMPVISHDKDAQAEDQNKPSLRELERQAYSRSSLHHHKSDPLHRRGRGQVSRSEGRGGGREGGGRGRGGAGEGEVGKGKGSRRRTRQGKRKRRERESGRTARHAPENVCDVGEN